jgi:hypothetical protein
MATYRVLFPATGVPGRVIGANMLAAVAVGSDGASAPRPR